MAFSTASFEGMVGHFKGPEAFIRAPSAGQEPERDFRGNAPTVWKERRPAAERDRDGRGQGAADGDRNLAGPLGTYPPFFAFATLTLLTVLTLWTVSLAGAICGAPHRRPTSECQRCQK